MNDTSMREPRGPSKAFTMSVGRGISIDGSAMSSTATPVSPVYAGRGVAVHARAADDEHRRVMENAQRPYEQYLVDSQVLQDYKPGLHRPGENYPVLPTPHPSGCQPKMVPDHLITEYRSGAKNEISAIFEYGSILKVKVEFREVAVSDRNAGQFAFACQCEVAGKTYPQGVGNTKKKAKTAAARIAMDTILEQGLNIPEDGLDDKSAASNVTDKTADRYDLGNKNEVMMLFELCAKKGLKLEPVVGNKLTPDGYFSCAFYGDGQLLSTAYALNKKEAKTKAAGDALKSLLFRDSKVVDVVHHWDAMAALVHQRVGWVMNSIPPPMRGWNVLAAFIVKRNQEDGGEVVSVGTGDACVVNSSLKTDGRAVTDCHAEVIARKALLKWFYKQIHLLYSNEPEPSSSIFEYNPESSKLSLKETVSFHMYISTAPCGDASAFPFENASILRAEEAETMNKGMHVPTFEVPAHGKLRVKTEIGCTTVPIDRITKQLTWRDLQNDTQKVRTMSCSDKIMRWNVVGLQGSLLSQYLEPVYLSSITIGSNFDLGHLARALCCRVTESISRELPDSYSLRHPFIGRVSVYEPVQRPVTTSRNVSVNWSTDDKLPEVLDANTGRSVDESPFITGEQRASRLSKAGFDFRFQKLAKATGNLHLIEDLETYAHRKQAAVPYFTARDRLFDYIRNARYGEWLAKPDELEVFTTECQ